MKYSLALVCLIACLNAWAGIGVVSDAKGTACSIERAKQKLPGGVGATIESMDTYVTGGCVSNITFKDDTKVKVTENSRLLIDDFVFDPKQSDAGKLALKVGMGTVRYASGQIAKNNPQKVDIKTPTASIAVRGTDFTATVDEMGESTIILLPSCPANWKDIERDCKTGAIDVMNDAGMVSLNVAFQGTKVASRTTMPMKPTVLNLTADTINNLLIVSPPRELRRDETADKTRIGKQSGNMLDVDYLKQNFLQNEFDKESTPFGDNPLAKPLLEQYFLENIFDIENLINSLE